MINNQHVTLDQMTQMAKLCMPLGPKLALPKKATTWQTITAVSAMTKQPTFVCLRVY